MLSADRSRFVRRVARWELWRFASRVIPTGLYLRLIMRLFIVQYVCRYRHTGWTLLWLQNRFRELQNQNRRRQQSLPAKPSMSTEVNRNPVEGHTYVDLFLLFSPDMTGIRANRRIMVKCCLTVLVVPSICAEVHFMSSSLSSLQWSTALDTNGSFRD